MFRRLLIATVVGILAAFAVAGFRHAMLLLEWLFLNNDSGSLVNAATNLSPWRRLLTPALGGLAAGLLLMGWQKFTQQRPHAPTDYMEALQTDGQFDYAASLVKSLASLLVVTSGSAIGREGAMILLAALAASCFAQRFTPRQEWKLWIACGAAAGMAAAYRAPLAGSLFIAEVLFGTMMLASLGPVIISAVVALLVSNLINQSRILLLSSQIAQNLIEYREENGAIKHHKDIAKVKRLGAKTFEQSIGFMRIVDGTEPLDNTSIHPESYDVTYQLLNQLNLKVEDLGSETLKKTLDSIDTHEIANQLNIGKPTLEDIIKSLKAPNRGPRDEFETPILKSDVLSIEDLSEGMKLSGTVRNVVDFGAFVDIGVKQDGLVHVSKLSKKFVKNPMDIVSVGDIVDVWILNIDKQKDKISLTMINPHE